MPREHSRAPPYLLADTLVQGLELVQDLVPLEFVAGCLLTELLLLAPESLALLGEGT